MMTNLTQHWVRIIFLGIAFSPLALHSETIDEADEVRELVGSRPLDPEMRDLSSRQRAYEDSTRDSSPFSYSSRFSPHSAESENVPTHLLFYPACLHVLQGVNRLERSIELEDGSQWEIIVTDQHVLDYWRRSDMLMITPNYNWFSSGDYYLTNRSNGSFVRANLNEGPKLFGKYSHWIIAIDHASGHVTLEDGVTWCIAAKDGFMLKEWEVNDHIVLGVYDNSSYSYDRILINVKMDTHVRATQY